MVRNPGQAVEEFSNVLLKMSHILTEFGEALKNNNDPKPKKISEYRYNITWKLKENKLQSKIDKRRSQRKMIRKNRYR